MAISAQDVKKLRDMTGAGMMDCKEALNETGGDFDAAVDFLRKKGLSKAAKKAGREAKEGAVAAWVADDARSGAMVEVNCETDFVARTADFVEFVPAALKQVALNGAEAIIEQKWHLDPSHTVGEVVTALVAKLGENMLVARGVRFEAGPNGVVHAYIHPGARVGVLLEAEADKAGAFGDAGLKTLVHDLAMQVAAAQARFVGPADVDEASKEKEREIAREQMKDSGKPAQVIEKIVEGKLAKFYEDVCLVEQPFIKDQNVKVKDLVPAAGKAAGASVKVVRFARFVLGEQA